MHHNENVIILLDEYDVPIENAYYEGFYDEMVGFIRSLFESALKTNDALQFGVVTRFSSSATTCSLQIQRDLLRASSSAQATPYSSSSTRSVPFPKLSKLSRWLTRLATQLFLLTAPVKQLTPLSLTSQLRSTPARSRPVLPADPSVLQSTTSSSASRNSSATALAIPEWAHST